MIIDDHLKPHILYKISKMYDKWDKILMSDDEKEYKKQLEVLADDVIKKDKDAILEFALLGYITKKLEENK